MMPPPPLLLRLARRALRFWTGGLALVRDLIGVALRPDVAVLRRVVEEYLLSARMGRLLLPLLAILALFTGFLIIFYRFAPAKWTHDHRDVSLFFAQELSHLPELCKKCAKP
ncbi:hypothetical protein [Qingshengfaniella alkalisoli]|uniref:hypothetical protein n=1 Tax=Qingshengfaniella alkalisoli TaxID=2599296 RepID=UPI001F0D39D3|nr:hypothetical protein [Qingshengfaniella alkalisoli]